MRELKRGSDEIGSGWVCWSESVCVGEGGGEVWCSVVVRGGVAE